MAWSSRSLKLAMLFFERVSAGFWPVISASSAFGVFQRLLHVGLGADAGVDDHLLDLGHLHDVLVAALLLQRRDDALLVLLGKVRLAMVVGMAFSFFCGLAFGFRFARLLAGFGFSARARRELDVGNVDRAFALDDGALRVVLRAAWCAS